jgi:hypothetical protein
MIRSSFSFCSPFPPESLKRVMQNASSLRNARVEWCLWWLIRPHVTVEGTGSALLPSSGTKWGGHSYSRISPLIISNLTEKRIDGDRLAGSYRRRWKPAGRRFQGATAEMLVVDAMIRAWSIIVPSQPCRFQANHHHASVVMVVDSAALDFGKISRCPKQKRREGKQS